MSLIKSLSVGNGIYGVNLGSSYQSVIDTLGDPSVILSELEEEVILGYGRNHWLHFKSNQLVKVSTRLPRLSTSFLNIIPLRDFFDEQLWQLGNKLTRHSLLTDIQSTLEVKTDLNSKNQLVLKNESNRLTLDFNFRKDASNGKQYYLSGFALQSNSYIKTTYKTPQNLEFQFHSLATAFSQLKQENVESWSSLKAMLGKPIGRIILSATSYLDVYNSNLLIEIDKAKLASIKLVEPLFNMRKSANEYKPWYLGDFIQNKSIAQLRSHFPVGALELDHKVLIDSDTYQMTLLFEELDSESALYEVKMSFY
jgi:hypothetical protein